MTGSATVEDAVWPVYTATSWQSNSGAPQWSTQCVVASGNDLADWTATVTAAMPGNVWQIDFTSGGNPEPGAHAIAWRAGAPNEPGGTLEADVISRQPIASYLASAGATQYGYHIPQDHNWLGSMTVDPSLESGSVDLWLIPSVPDGANLEFHITGTWACD